MPYTQTKQAIRKYLSARKEFLDYAKNKEELKGNDNIMGRIGEFIAEQYLRDEGRLPVRPRATNNACFDFDCSGLKVSVKLMSCENTSGSSSEVKGDWHELILVELDEDYLPSRLGHVTRERFEDARKEGFFTAKKLITKRNLLDDNGLMQIYGEVVPRERLENYL